MATRCAIASIFTGTQEGAESRKSKCGETPVTRPTPNARGIAAISSRVQFWLAKSPPSGTIGLFRAEKNLCLVIVQWCLSD